MFSELKSRQEAYVVLSKQITKEFFRHFENKEEKVHLLQLVKRAKQGETVALTASNVFINVLQKSDKKEDIQALLDGFSTRTGHKIFQLDDMVEVAMDTKLEFIDFVQSCGIGVKSLLSLTCVENHDYHHSIGISIERFYMQFSELLYTVLNPITGKSTVVDTSCPPNYTTSEWGRLDLLDKLWFGGFAIRTFKYMHDLGFESFDEFRSHGVFTKTPQNQSHSF